MGTRNRTVNVKSPVPIFEKLRLGKTSGVELGPNWMAASVPSRYLGGLLGSSGVKAGKLREPLHACTVSVCVLVIVSCSLACNLKVMPFVTSDTSNRWEGLWL